MKLFTKFITLIKLHNEGVSCEWFGNLSSLRGAREAGALLLTNGGDADVVCGDLQTVRRELVTGTGPIVGLHDKRLPHAQTWHFAKEVFERNSCSRLLVWAVCALEGRNHQEAIGKVSRDCSERSTLCWFPSHNFCTSIQ